MEEMKSVFIERLLKERAEEEIAQLKIVYLEESQKPRRGAPPPRAQQIDSDSC
jgi:hypothetical protein